MKPTNWKREATAWRKCADRLAKAVEHYRGSDEQHMGAKSKALTIYRTMARRRSSALPNAEFCGSGEHSRDKHANS